MMREISGINDAPDAVPHAIFHVPNESARLTIQRTVETINETCTHVSAYRDNPQRADDFAFGFVRGVLSQLRGSDDPATRGFAEALLAQVADQGIDAVRNIIHQVNGRQ
jgi:hypothetical protein